MRISSLAPLLLLAACEPRAPDLNVIERVEAGATQAAAADDRVECAPPGQEGFTRDCVVERVQGDAGLLLTVRQPNGGFHRLRVTGDGRGVVAADGAEPATVTIAAPGVIEVAIGGARYRLPATVKGTAAAR